MKALKLKLSPNSNQYKTLDEIFRKWASICNRYNHYTYQKNMKEEDIKKKLEFDPDLQTIQFSSTQTNQQAKKDNSDLIRAMGELKKQKEREIVSLEERYNPINDALSDEKNRDIDPNKPSNMKPKGWYKFHTLNYWKEESEKLDRQIKKKKITIEKIEKKKIHFKPKRMGLWSSSYKINFKSKKLLLKPFANDKKVVVGIVTEPIQPHRSSSLKSKLFLQKTVKDFVIFSLHKVLFGLANNEEPMVKRKVNPFVVFNYSSERNKEKQEAKEKFKSLIIKDRFKKWSDISESDEVVINEEIEKFWSNTKDEFNLHKTKKLQDVFSQKYLDLISRIDLNLKSSQKSLLEKKKYLFNKNKLPEWKKEYNLNEGEIKTLSEEIDKAFGGTAQEFVNHNFSHDYIQVLNRLADFQLNRDELYEINKYPILFRKPTTKIKNLYKLKPEEWKYYIQFGYDQINKPHIKSSSILGIDRGINSLLAYSIFDPEQSKFVFNELEPNPIVGWKWKLRKLKKSIQHLERKIRAQKGVHIPENQMKKRFRSIENKVEDLYHNISRKIVNIAKTKNASIVFENLEQQGLKQHGRKKNARMKKLNYKLSLFDYAKIASLVHYKAENDGIQMYDVEAAYTSQNCAKCVLENGKFVDGIVISYFEDFNEGDNINSALLEGTDISTAKIKKITNKEIQAEGKNKDNNYVKFTIKKGFNKISFIDENKEEISEFQTRIENTGEKEKTAIIDYVYKRCKEFVNGKPKYTGNKKVGYCTKHGQIDADLNAARVIALCKYFQINRPVPFGTRKLYK